MFMLSLKYADYNGVCCTEFHALTLNNTRHSSQTIDSYCIFLSLKLLSLLSLLLLLLVVVVVVVIVVVVYVLMIVV